MKVNRLVKLSLTPEQAQHVCGALALVSQFLLMRMRKQSEGGAGSDDAALLAKLESGIKPLDYSLITGAQISIDSRLTRISLARLDDEDEDLSWMLDAFPDGYVSDGVRVRRGPNGSVEFENE